MIINRSLVRGITLGVENLLLHKLRSFLTMLGVLFGVGSVVAMLSVGEGASKEALDHIRKIGSNDFQYHASGYCLLTISFLLSSSFKYPSSPRCRSHGVF